MFEGDVGVNEGPAWMDADDGWRSLHRKLVEVSRQRRVLEAEETDLLLEAEDSRLYRRLGHVSMHEYMEAHLGYTQHTANERLRTARELLALPKLRDAYRSGELSFTAVRELTRVATPATEEAFLAAAEGKTAGEVQQLVSGRGKGDTPETPPDPRLARRRVVLELSAEEHAMWSRMRTLVADELGHHVEDGVLVRMLAGIVAGADLRASTSDDASESGGQDEGAAYDHSDGHHTRSQDDRHGASDDTHERSEVDDDPRTQGTGPSQTDVVAAAPSVRAPRPSLLHAVSTCMRCMTTVAVTAGTEAPLTTAERSRIECDALRIGDVSKEGGRVQSAVPAGTRLKVFVRDRFRCAVPGCRSRRCLEVHHILPRSLGGTNELSNLILLCAGHHHLHHEGKLRIEGRAPAVTITWTNLDEADRSTPLTTFGRAAKPARVSDAHAGM